VNDLWDWVLIARLLAFTAGLQKVSAQLEGSKLAPQVAVNNQKGTMRYFASACGDERTALGLRSAKSDAPVPLNIVCFRYSDHDLSNSQLNELNEELMVRLQESGVAVISSTVVHGTYALRVAITNHRSRRSEFDQLLTDVLRLRALLREEYD